MTDNEVTAQRIRNVFYALSAVAAVLGYSLDEAYIEPIVLGILAAISLISSAVAWWYSRRKFTVKLDSGEHTAS